MYQLVRQKGPIKDVTFEIGHFALDTAADEIAGLVRKFMTFS